MKISTTHIPLSLLICSAAQLFADEKDTIGHTDLLARVPGLDGSGLRIALVEAGTAYQPSPAAATQDPNKFSFFDGATVYPAAGAYEPSKQSSHANTVADKYFDLHTGVATDVNEIHVFSASYFFNSIVNGGPDIGAPVVNQSFIFNASVNDELIKTRYDNYAANYNTLFVNGLNNGSGTTVSPPASAYNGIAVGREDLDHSQGPLDLRSKPDIISPGNRTAAGPDERASFATPYVSGSAAILIEAALSSNLLENGGSGTATAASDIRTIKALLLNGAVKDSAWSHTSVHPLDTSRGAGLLNINHSHLQLQGGKHSSTSSTDESSGGIHIPDSGTSGNVSSAIGWDFATITDTSRRNTTKDRVENYYFNHTSIKDLVATLTWNRQANESSINNLDLYLFNADTGVVVESSVSTVDNIEHIYREDLPIGRYVLQVVKRGANSVSKPEDYALAFRFSDPAPDAPSALTAAAESDRKVGLTWADNSTDELNFEIQRSPYDDRSFDTIAIRPADTTSYTDTAPLESTTYYYRVKATNANGDSFYNNVASVTTLNKLMSWRYDNFGSSADTGNAANSADPDEDGLNNLTEYALSTDPNSAAGDDGGSAQPKSSIVDVGGTDYLQITVTRVANKSDLNYIVEVSGDFLTWLPATNILENTATALRVRDNVAVAGNSPRFIRLKVEEK